MHPIYRIFTLWITLTTLLTWNGYGKTREQTSADTALSPLPIYRTIATHEITAFSSPVCSPHLSADGSRIAFLGPISGSSFRGLYLVNFDGSGLHTVDTEGPGQSYTSCDLSLSANGLRIAGNLNYHAVRVVDTDTGTVHTVPRSPGVIEVKLTADGNTVFFSQASTTDPNNPIGVYRMSADGSSLKRIISPEMIAAAVGVPASTVDVINLQGPLTLSNDGGHLAFIIMGRPSANNNLWMFTANGDGSGLRLLRSPGGYYELGLSADGDTLFFHFIPSGPGIEWGTWTFLRWNGTQINSFAAEAETQLCQWGQLSSDGAYFAKHCSSSLYTVSNGQSVLLLQRGSFNDTLPPPKTLVTLGWVQMSMDGSAHRFAHVAKDLNGIEQIITTEINPTDLGQAPSISQVTLDPPYVMPDYGNFPAFSFHLHTPEILGYAIGTRAFLNGAVVNNILEPWFVYTGADADYSTTLDASSAAPGVYDLRIVVDIATSDGRRHATSVDVALVVGSGPAPASSAAINFTNGKTGSFFIISGDHFAPGCSATLRANARLLTSLLAVDNAGHFSFNLDTALAGPGTYAIEIGVTPPITLAFRLDPNAPQRTSIGSGPTYVVPAGIAMTHETYLPAVWNR